MRSRVALLGVLLAIPAASLVAPSSSAAPPVVEDRLVASFDGTVLAITVFYPGSASASNRVPFILLGHDWGESRATTLSGRVADLVAAGYGVVSWDSRGFGRSTGESMFNAPTHEVRDVQALVTWIAQNTPVILQSATDPWVGMSGAGYAGSIQLLAAAVDPRIDVLAPESSWSDLNEALAPGGAVKMHWTARLMADGVVGTCAAGHQVGTGGFRSGCVSPKVLGWFEEMHVNGSVPPHVRAEFAARSASLFSVTKPTLVVQGFPDTLYDAKQGVNTFETLRLYGRPTKLWLHDGGHAGPGTQSHLVPGVVRAWFACHLKVPADCSGVGPNVEYFTTDGRWLSSPSWPPAQTTETSSWPAGVVLGNVVGSVAEPAHEIPECTGRSNHPVLQGTNLLPLAGTACRLASGGILVLLKDCGVFPGTDLCRTAAGRVRFETRVTAAPELWFFVTVGIRDTTGNFTRVNDQTQPIRVGPGPLVEQSVVVETQDFAAGLRKGESLILVIEGADLRFHNPRPASAQLFDQTRSTFGYTLH